MTPAQVCCLLSFIQVVAAGKEAPSHTGGWSTEHARCMHGLLLHKHWLQFRLLHISTASVLTIRRDQLYSWLRWQRLHPSILHTCRRALTSSQTLCCNYSWADCP